MRGGAIGDFIVTLPALQALRARWPDAYIELLGYPHIAGMAAGGGLVNKVASLDQARIARFFALKPIFTPDQVEYIRSFDLVICYLHDPEESLRKNLQLAGAKQVIYGSPLVTSSHAIEHLMKPLETLAIYSQQDVPKLIVAEDDQKKGRDFLNQIGVERALAIHPGSGSPKKNWPLENFISVARKFTGRSFFVVGEADAAIAGELRVKAADIPVLANRPLADVASVLSASDQYMGNDSGITHVAAAIGIPVVAIFGPTSTLQWGPRGPNVRIARAPGGDLTKLNVEQVLGNLSPTRDAS